MLFVKGGHCRIPRGICIAAAYGNSSSSALPSHSRFVISCHAGTVAPSTSRAKPSCQALHPHLPHITLLITLFGIALNCSPRPGNGSALELVYNGSDATPVLPFALLAIPSTGASVDQRAFRANLACNLYRVATILQSVGLDIVTTAIWAGSGTMAR
jgi:hypothetical protein